MKNLIETFNLKGRVNTHYFNGYGFTNKTKDVKEKLELKGLIKGVNFKIIQLNGSKTKTQIVAI